MLLLNIFYCSLFSNSRDCTMHFDGCFCANVLDFSALHSIVPEKQLKLACPSWSHVPSLPIGAR